MITLEDAKSLPLDGSAWVEFISHPGVLWSVIGRYPTDERHPERVRIVIENPERGESYFTEAHLDKVLNWSPDGGTFEPGDVVPVPEIPAEDPQPAIDVVETGDPALVETDVPVVAPETVVDPTTPEDPAPAEG